MAIGRQLLFPTSWEAKMWEKREEGSMRFIMMAAGFWKREKLKDKTQAFSTEGASFNLQPPGRARKESCLKSWRSAASQCEKQYY